MNPCTHEDFWGIQTAYDHRRGVLVYFWTCEQCGARLDEATRMDYRPSYDRDGHQKFLASYTR